MRSAIPHRLGVIHRDIKPANVIMLDRRRRQGRRFRHRPHRVVEHDAGGDGDGHAELHVAGADHGTARRRAVGSLLRRRHPVPVPDRRASVQPARRPPTMHKVLEEDPLPPSRFNVQVPGAMDAVVRKALAKRPDERYQTAEEFAAALRAAAQTTQTQTATTDAAVLAARGRRRVIAPANATSTSGPRPPPRQRRMPWHGGVSAPAKKVAGNGHRRRRRASPSSPFGVAPVVAIPAAGGAMARRSRKRRRTLRLRAGRRCSVRAGGGPRGDENRSRQHDDLRRGAGRSQRPRYGTDKALMQSDLRADAKSQVVAKALGLMIDPGLAREVLRHRRATSCSPKAGTTFRRSSPRARRGSARTASMSMTTQAVVNVRALQKSVNQMSRDERVEFIRSSGDPKISVRIAVRDADQPNAPPQPSPVAENLLKERIKAFGFRTWSEDGNPADPKQNADFVGAGRSAGQEAVGQARGLRRRRHEVRARRRGRSSASIAPRARKSTSTPRCRRVSAAGPARATR